MKTPSTTWNDTAREVARILSAQVLTEVDPDTELVESGLLDSVGVVRLLVAVEAHFGVSLAFEDLGIEDIRSIASLAELIDRELGRAVEEEEDASATMPRSACQA